VTKAELREETYRRLGEAGVSATFFSDDDVDEAITEGLMELSDETEWYEVSQTVDLCMDRLYYDVRTIFPDREVLTPGRVFNVQTNRWLVPSSVRDLDAAYARWEQITGQPDRVLTRGLWWVGYWPMTSAESGTVTQYATALPEALEDDEDRPELPTVYHDALVQYALAILLPQAGEVTKALAAWERYMTAEGALVATVAGRGAVPMGHGHAAARRA